MRASSPQELLYLLGLALSVALVPTSGFASPPPAASTVTIYNCVVIPGPDHLHIAFASYNSNDLNLTVAYEHSSYLDSRTSTSGSPASATLHCATSDGCKLKGVAEACGSAGTSSTGCGDEVKTFDAVKGDFEFAREGFSFTFRQWQGRCR